MAGTVTATIMKIKTARGKTIHKIVADWLCDASGDADKLLISEAGLAEDDIFGKILSYETAPGNQGDLSTNLPTALYDAVLNDTYGADVAAGVLGNRSGTVAEITYPGTGRFPLAMFTEDIDIVVSNAGNAKEGRIIIIIDPIF